MHLPTAPGVQILCTEHLCQSSNTGVRHRVVGKHFIHVMLQLMHISNGVFWGDLYNNPQATRLGCRLLEAWVVLTASGLVMNVCPNITRIASGYQSYSRTTLDFCMVSQRAPWGTWRCGLILQTTSSHC